jgi:hypothetical protein
MIDKKELYINDDRDEKFVSIWVNECPIHSINGDKIKITATYIHLYKSGEIITSFARPAWDDIYYSNESKGFVMDAVPLIDGEGQ